MDWLFGLAWLDLGVNGKVYGWDHAVHMNRWIEREEEAEKV